jgi:ATP:ADP antiporter, AAA family
VRGVRAGEWPALVLSFLFFFLLLAAYYTIRSIRDSLVSGLGTAELRSLVTAVFFVMLTATPIFGALMTRVPRRRLLPWLFAFFAVNLAAFATAFATLPSSPWPARIFYVWILVFNFFSVSVFWSFMADIWREEQGRRLFGMIAAGGSIGGLVGPALTQTSVAEIGNAGVTAIAAVLLSGTVACLLALRSIAPTQLASSDSASAATAIVKEAAFSGSVWQGFILVLKSPFLLGIASLVLIGTTTAQFFYSDMARLAKESFESPEARTVFYANLDFWTNAISVVLQALVVGFLTTRFGVALPLVGLAAVGFLAYGSLAISPLLGTLAISTVARRSGEFGLGKPARDMLYTVATPQEKYLAKNVIDTVLSRGGDFVAVWIYSALTFFGIGLAGLGAIAATAMIGAVVIALAIVRGYRKRGGK